jgi:WD40 repeat protein
MKLYIPFFILYSISLSAADDHSDLLDLVQAQFKTYRPIQLRSADGSSFLIPESLARVSGTLRNQTEKNEPIDLSHFSDELLEDQIGLMYEVSEQRKKRIKTRDIVKSLIPHYQAADSDDLEQSICAARYLDVKEMFQAASEIGTKRKRADEERREREKNEQIQGSDICVFLTGQDNQTVVIKKNEQENFTCDLKMFDCAGSTFNNAALDFPAESKVHLINEIFSSLSKEQTGVLIDVIQAAYSDKISEVDNDDSHITSLVSRYGVSTLDFLLRKSNYLDMPSVQQICSQQLAKKLNYSFEQVYTLPYELILPILNLRFGRFNQLINRQIHVKEIARKEGATFYDYMMLKRDEAQLFIKTAQEVLIYDMQSNRYTVLFEVDDDSEEIEEMIVSFDETKILVKTNLGLLAYDLQDGSKKVFHLKDTGYEDYFVVPDGYDDEWIQFVDLSPDGNKVFIQTDHNRTFLWDLNTGEEKLLSGHEEAEEDHQVTADDLEAAVEGALMVTTALTADNALQMEDSDDDYQDADLEGLSDDSDEEDTDNEHFDPHFFDEQMGDIQMVLLNFDGKKVLVCTDRQMVYRDIEQRTVDISIDLEGARYVQSPDFLYGEEKVFICTNDHVLTWDIHKNNKQLHFEAAADEEIQKAMLNKDQRYLLIKTDKQVVLCDVETDELRQIYAISIAEEVEESDESDVSDVEMDDVQDLEESDDSADESDAYDEDPVIHINDEGQEFYEENGVAVLLDQVVDESDDDHALEDDDAIQGGQEYEPDESDNDDEVVPNISEVKYATFNGIGDKVLIVAQEDLIVQEVKTGKSTVFKIPELSHIDGVENYWLHIKFNAQKDKMLIRTDRHIFVYDLQDKVYKVSLKKDPGEVISCAYFNHAGDKVIIGTSNRVLVWPLFTMSEELFFVNLEKENIESPQDQMIKQFDLIGKASRAWKNKNVYKLASDEERELYAALPTGLQKKELFS